MDYDEFGQPLPQDIQQMQHLTDPNAPLNVISTTRIPQPSPRVTKPNPMATTGKGYLSIYFISCLTLTHLVVLAFLRLFLPYILVDALRRPSCLLKLYHKIHISAALFSNGYVECVYLWFVTMSSVDCNSGKHVV